MTRVCARTKSLLIPGWLMSGLYMKNKVLNVERFHWSNATDAQVLRHVGELARLNEKVGVVD
jgi:transposase